MGKRYPQAILASCELPWDEDEQLIEETFREEVRSTLASGYAHLYIFGTAGEGYAVTLGQFRDIAGIFWEETDKPGVHPQVGIIGMSTGQVVEKIGVAHDLGFRIFQISLPPWGELTDNEYMTYFKDVCGSFPDASFLHYNLPRPKRVLVTEDYKRLQEAVPNLVATKYTSASPAECATLVTQTEIQHFFGEDNFPYGCLYGECSLLASWAAIAPRKVHELFNAGVAGEFDKLFRTQVEIARMGQAFLDPAMGVERIDGAYDKMMIRASGVDMPLRLLSPYQGVDLETYEACFNAVREQYGDWLG